MRKIAYLIIAAFSIIPFVLGTSVYEYDSSGFHIFEDFLILNDYNHSIWKPIGTSWGFNGTDMYFADNESSTVLNGILIENDNFRPYFQDEWIAESRVKLVSCGSGQYSEPHFNIQEGKTQVLQYNITQQILYSYYSNYFSSTCNYANTYLGIDAVGNDSVERYTEHTGNHNNSVLLASQYVVFKQIKRNNPNGSYSIATFIDDALLYNHSSTFLNPYVKEMLITNYTYNPAYFLIEGINSAGNNHLLYFDWVNVTLTRYQAPLADTTPNVTITSPANATTSNQSVNVTFTAIDKESSSMICKLYIDSVLNLTNATTLNNTATRFSPNWSSGAHNFYVNCTDGTNAVYSAVYSFTFNPVSCVPNWVCGGYTACNTSDLAACTSATDSNTCGAPYTGDLSEFPAQACNYCSRNIVSLNQTACSGGSFEHCYNDSNYATCCAVTGIASDCFGDIVQSQPDVCVNESCSGFSYSYDDFTGAVIDGTVKFIVGLGSLAFLVGAALLGSYIYKRTK